MESNDSILPTEPQTPSKLRGAHYAGDRPTREKLDQLYNKQKLSSGEIARQYSVTRQTVTNWLEMEGFDRRTGTEAAMLRFAAQAEFVPLAEREDCVLDRAWEARPERRIRDKVSCRLCFQQVSRLLGKTAHFSTCHEGMTGDEYARLMPRHRHDCFQHSADSNGLEVEKLMDDWCTEWATADEIRNWRRDPKLAQVDEYVGCLECGRKLFSGAEIQRHLRKIHNWSLEQYRELYPSAPTGSLDRRAMQSEKSKRRNRRIADAKLKVRELEQQLENAKAEVLRLKDQEQGVEAKVGKAVEDAIPRFELLSSSPELQRDRKILDSYWRHPDFTQEEMDAAREAHEKRVPKKTWAITAARSFVSIAMQLTADTVRQYHHRYLKSLQSPQR